MNLKAGRHWSHCQAQKRLEAGWDRIMNAGEMKANSPLVPSISLPCLLVSSHFPWYLDSPNNGKVKDTEAGVNERPSGKEGIFLLTLRYSGCHTIHGAAEGGLEKPKLEPAQSFMPMPGPTVGCPRPLSLFRREPWGVKSNVIAVLQNLLSSNKKCTPSIHIFDQFAFIL